MKLLPFYYLFIFIHFFLSLFTPAKAQMEDQVNCSQLLTLFGDPWSSELDAGRLKIMDAINRFELTKKVDIEKISPNIIKKLINEPFHPSEIAAAKKELIEMNLFGPLLENSNKNPNEKNYDRLAPIFLLAKKIYTLVDPQDEYTKLTDGEGKNHKGHYWIVTNLLNKPVKLTTAVAALFHDIERYVPQYKVTYEDLLPIPQLKGRNLDTVLRKEVIHPQRSAQVAQYLLKNFNLSGEELNTIQTLIRYHDASAKGVQIRISDQEELSLLPALTENTNNNDIKKEIEILSDADATAFFYMTFPLFVEREFKKFDKYQAQSAERTYLEENLKSRVVKTLFGRISSKKQKLEALRLAKTHLKNDQSPQDEFLKKIIESLSQSLEH